MNGVTDVPLAPTTDGLTEEASIVIFGASGDLTARKLLPALFHLWRDGFLSSRAPIIGAARRPKSDDEFREEIFAHVQKHSRSGTIDRQLWNTFAQRLHYRQLDLSQPGEYPAFRQELERLEREAGVAGKRLFYLATTPDLFIPTVQSVAKAGLIPPRHSDQTLRVVFEKPFGRDLGSARELQTSLGRLLREEQIYRIDHYLGKETVQNLLLFRFGNAIFEPLFNRTHVDHVQITVAEAQGMEHGRGGYYDSSGALRDVLQNHVLQLLALVAMEPPSSFRGKEIRDEKVKVLDALAPAASRLEEWAVRGQYTRNGPEMPGYLEEDRIPAHSQTETYAALAVKIDNWRWEGVPFYLRTGKRLPRRVSEIAIQFKLPPLHLFKTVECEGDICELVEARPNQLVFRIQPSESISLSCSAKRPGMQYQIHPVTLDFAFDQGFKEVALPEAYERLLLDVLRGDSTLFMRNDELDAAWRLVTPVLDGWANSTVPPAPYAAGSWGPDAADRLLGPVGRRWRTP